MAYATIADMEKRLAVSVLVQLTGDSQGGAAYNTAINEELDQASAVVDSYAATRFDTPLQDSTRVRQLVTDIGAYELEKNKGTVRETDRAAYEDAIRFLRDLAAGKATLDQPSGAPAQTGSLEPKVTTKERIMSDDHLSGY